LLLGGILLLDVLALSYGVNSRRSDRPDW